MRESNILLHSYVSLNVVRKEIECENARKKCRNINTLKKKKKVNKFIKRLPACGPILPFAGLLFVVFFVSCCG